MPRILVLGDNFRNGAIDLSIFEKSLEFPVLVTPGPTEDSEESIKVDSIDELPGQIDICLKLSPCDFVAIEGSFKSAGSL